MGKSFHSKSGSSGRGRGGLAPPLTEAVKRIKPGSLGLAEHHEATQRPDAKSKLAGTMGGAEWVRQDGAGQVKRREASRG